MPVEAIWGRMGKEGAAGCWPPPIPTKAPCTCDTTDCYLCSVVDGTACRPPSRVWQLEDGFRGLFVVV